jgi:hypothetical protein
MPGSALQVKRKRKQRKQEVWLQVWSHPGVRYRALGGKRAEMLFKTEYMSSKIEGLVK